MAIAPRLQAQPLLDAVQARQKKVDGVMEQNARVEAKLDAQCYSANCVVM